MDDIKTLNYGQVHCGVIAKQSDAEIENAITKVCRISEKWVVVITVIVSLLHWKHKSIRYRERTSTLPIQRSNDGSKAQSAVRLPVQCSSGTDQQASNEADTIPKEIVHPSYEVNNNLVVQLSSSDLTGSDGTSGSDTTFCESRNRGGQSKDQMSKRTVDDIVNIISKCSQEVMYFGKRQLEIFKKLIEMKTMKPDEITERVIIFPFEIGSHTLKYEKKGKPIAKGTYGSVFLAILVTLSGRIKDCVVKQISFEKFNVTEAFIPLVMGEQIPQVPELHAIIREKDNFMIFMEKGLELHIVYRGPIETFHDTLRKLVVKNAQICYQNALTVVDIVSGGTLNKHERTWGTSCIVSCLYSVLCGLLEMHVRLGAHFDIKYSNLGFWDIVRDPRRMAIYDYGSMKTDTEPPLLRQTKNYTVEYVAPEFRAMHRDKQERHFAPEYFKFDVWAIAVTVYELVVGKSIWNELTEYSNFKKANDRSHKKTTTKGKLLKQIANEGVKEATEQLRKIPVENDPLKQQLVGLLLKMLTEASKRIQIQDAVNHPVFDLPKSQTVHVEFVIDKEATVFEEIVPKGTKLAECLARPYIPSEVKEATRYLSSDDKDVHIFESDMSVYVKK